MRPCPTLPGVSPMWGHLPLAGDAYAKSETPDARLREGGECRSVFADVAEVVAQVRQSIGQVIGQADDGKVARTYRRSDRR